MIRKALVFTIHKLQIQLVGSMEKVINTVNGTLSISWANINFNYFPLVADSAFD